MTIEIHEDDIPPPPSTNYYAQGSKELATETPVTVRKLEHRQELTKNSTRLVIALVGLPARGKSFVARKILHYLNWTGAECKIFNVGRYRRDAYRHVPQETQDKRAQIGACDASFFDSQNEHGARLREKVAEVALKDMLKWLDDDSLTRSSDKKGTGGRRNGHESPTNLPPGMPKLNFHDQERIAIFDATNSTHKRRRWILEQCTSTDRQRQGKRTGVVFVESICDDNELLEENYRFKISNSPDFDGMSQEEAIVDLRSRVAKYEEQYETIKDDSLSYVKIFNLSTKLMVNHIYGRMAKELVPALMSWHIGTRPVFLCRPGQTVGGVLTDCEDYPNPSNQIDPNDPTMMDMSKRKSLRGDKLGPNGERFRSELLAFCREESHAFMQRRASVHDMALTGTSISGIEQPFGYGEAPQSASNNATAQNERNSNTGNFPIRIFTSTMPRAADSVDWENDVPIQQMSNLNPLDKGDFTGMELDQIMHEDPTWYSRLEQDPYHTRFTGGESYADLVLRLSSVVIDVEQQVIPTLVVSHLSILQCLMAYFRNTSVEKCTGIEVPMHTIIKFTPVRGGGWSETHHPMFGSENHGKGMIAVSSESDFSQASLSSNESLKKPIWDDQGPISPTQSNRSDRIMTLRRVEGDSPGSSAVSSIPPGLPLSPATRKQPQYIVPSPNKSPPSPVAL